MRAQLGLQVRHLRGDLTPERGSFVALQPGQELDDGAVHRSPRRLTRIASGQELAEHVHPPPFLGHEDVVLAREVPEEGALGDLG